MISFMLAMDRNRLIGADNGLPWRLPRDWAYFKKTTLGHTVLMGRKTWESIGQSLTGRQNVVITRQRDLQEELLARQSAEESGATSVTVRHSLNEALEEFGKDRELFVIGGAEIFKASLPFADRMYITLIDHEFTGDAHFPEINMSEWQETSKVKGMKDEKNPYDYYFIIYDRRRD